MIDTFQASVYQLGRGSLRVESTSFETVYVGIQFHYALVLKCAEAKAEWEADAGPANAVARRTDARLLEVLESVVQRLGNPKRVNLWRI